MIEEANSVMDQEEQRIVDLVRALCDAERELQELTGGQHDGVAGDGGKTYLLSDAQERLRTSEEAQRRAAETQTAILDALPANIALIDSQGVIVEVNKSWRQFASANVLQGTDFWVGRNYVEVCERGGGETSHEAHSAAAGIRRVLAGTAGDFSLEYPCHSPTQRRWYRLMVTPVRKDARAGAVVMHIDTTERRLAVEAMQSTMEEFRTLAEAMPQIVWMTRPDGWNVYFNQRWTDYTGLTLDESLGEGWNKPFHPEDALRASEAWAKAVSTGGLYEVEARLRRADGEYRWWLVRGVPQLGPGGKVLKWFGTCTDIHDLKLAELEVSIAMSEVSQQAALLDAASDAIILRTMDNRILFWNKGAELMYGWTPKEVLGEDLRQILDIDFKEFDRAFALLMKDGTWTGEKSVRHRDGREMTVYVRWTLLRDEEGRPKSILAIHSDMTERKKLDAQLLRMQRMESIGTLAGGIAHDLNNALAPILMATDVLRESLTDEASLRVLAAMESSAQHGADLVRQVLSFARGVEGRKVEVNVVHLLTDIKAMIRDTFPKDIEFRFTPRRDLWTVTGDPTQLHQVFTNLCVNARDAMPNGGTLKVTVENATIDHVYAGMNPDASPGPYLLIKVADTGAGIPPGIRERIFEPFFTTKEIGKGTGLGLSTSMGIVKSHGGFINLYSEMGKGTSFSVYLPANTAPAGAEAPASGKPELPRGNGEIVLLVDDEINIRTVAQTTLEGYGYRVMQAANGAEAVALYAQNPGRIAVVLTDMAMPVMDGPALIVALRAMNPEVNIIGSTGMASEAAVPKAVLAGIRHFIPKPYTAETMLKTLNAALRERPGG